MIAKKVIVCDLDGTLTPSKSPLSFEMSSVLSKILSRHLLVVVSGGALSQFQKQFLSQLHCSSEELQNLLLFPTSGTSCYKFELESGKWKEVYNEIIPDIDRQKIIKALKSAITDSGVDVSGAFGEVIEDRGSQITFSGKGQEAPIEIKRAWDPDKTKRRQIVELLKKSIPQFEPHINAISSIDITRPGVDKAYAIKKIKEILDVSDDDIIFIGDALFQGGNDAPVKETAVDYIQESGPEETIELLRQYL